VLEIEPGALEQVEELTVAPAQEIGYGRHRGSELFVAGFGQPGDP
jgi:hypothetical protein